MGEKVVIFSDLHSEIIDNAEERIEEIIRYIKEKQPNFIINLGDFGYFGNTDTSYCDLDKMPINLKILHEEKTDYYKKRAIHLLEELKELQLPIYSVLGNHDLDFCSKEEMLTFYGIEKSFYSIELENYLLLFLDTTYIRDKDGTLKDYDHGNYFNHEGSSYLPTEQLDWLDYQLSETSKKVVLFSHHPLTHDPRAINNRDELEKILNKHNHVIAAINGHTHKDKAVELGGTHYITLNSASYEWVGKLNQLRYKNVNTDRYPCVNYTNRYADPNYYGIEFGLDKMKLEEGSSTKIGEGRERVTRYVTIDI